MAFMGRILVSVLPVRLFVQPKIDQSLVTLVSIVVIVSAELRRQSVQWFWNLLDPWLKLMEISRESALTIGWVFGVILLTLLVGFLSAGS